jgi:ribosomal protein S18 acetylase RimI-like enzyme
VKAAAPGIEVLPIPADFERWEALLGVIRASFAYMDGVIDPPSSAHRLTPDALRDRAAAEIGFLALSGDAIAGCAFLAEKPDHFYLGKLAVSPAYQGRGVGRALLKAAEEHARRAGKDVIELQTRVELTDNHRLFAALGFVETARTAHQGHDRPTSVTMRKRVA